MNRSKITSRKSPVVQKHERRVSSDKSRKMIKRLFVVYHLKLPAMYESDMC